MLFPCPNFVKKLIEYLERFFALIDHNHDTDYASIDHNHDADYAAIDHNHDTDYAPLDHNHDERYYTETEVQNLFDVVYAELANKSDVGHDHDERYYTETEVDALLAGIGGGTIIGEMRAIAHTNIPAGWLLADGALVSRTTYTDLFNAIGTKFGAGDGSTTFQLPSLVGRFPIGCNTPGMLGQTGGESEHTLIVDEMPTHGHPIWRSATQIMPSGSAIRGLGNAIDPGLGDASRNVGGNQPHNNMPPYLAIYFIIYAGV